MSDPEQEAVERRKDAHLDVVLNEAVGSSGPAVGLGGYTLEYDALPELDLDEVDLSVAVLGKRLAAPIVIGAMTGGTTRAGDINRTLARAAARVRVGMALGSQRAMIVKPALTASFAVREAAPDLPLLFGNVGAVQLNYGFDVEKLVEAVRSIGADGLFLHLNALQELVQPGGDTNFRGLYDRIAEVARAVDFPVIIKEVGCGIAPKTARRLAGCGVAAIDVAGAGGTSWAKIEGHRADDPGLRTLGDVFGNWGIPTAVSLQLCREALPTMPLIASGGMRTGLDAAKALALGADLVSFAMPLLGPATRSAEEATRAVDQLMLELRAAMFLIGVRSIDELRASRHRLRVRGA
jgi:isopentenyl-diphosphate delta-isomerase